MLKDWEQFSLGHEKSTAKKHYVSEDLKQSMALGVHKWFRDQVNKSEETAQIEYGIYISEEQDLRIRDELKDVSMAKLKHWCSKVDRKEELRVITLAKLISDREIAALLRMIATSDELNWRISEAGSLMDIFFTGKNTRSKSCKSIIKRLLHLYPDYRKDAMILKENVLEYAELLAATDDEYSPKVVLTKWTEKMLNSLRKLRTSHVANPNILLIFADLSLKFGVGKYCFGNKSLELSMETWIELSQRHSRLTHGEDQRISPGDFLEQHYRKVVTEKETKLSSPSLECTSQSLECTSPSFECSVDTDDETNVVSLTGFNEQSLLQIKVITPSKRVGIDFDDDLKKKMLIDLIKYSDNFLDIVPRTGEKRIAEACNDIRNHEVIYKGELKLWKQLASPRSMAHKLSRRGFDFQGWESTKGGSGDKSTGLLSFLRELLGNDDISDARDRLGEIVSKVDKKLDQK